jgi:large subunit ribosomal protein L3
MKYILGTKIGMVQLYETSGHVIPSTVIHCEPNVVLEIKTPEKHGHNAIKVGYKTTKENKNNQAHNGIFKKVNVPARKIIRTFTNPTGTFKIGDLIGVSQFTPGEYVDVQGVTRGRGFTGAIQR